MQCLVEVNNQNELKRALAHNIKIIGINNRNLDTMKVDINVTRQLRPPIPRGRIVVSESGIKGRDEVEKLKKWKVNAMLVGEALVTADDVAAKIKELL
jgi:indole-3-glycerol phosphate synthase